MKDKKRRLELFSFYDHTGIARHLERMAAQGWLLEKIGLLWTYRRTEPKKLAFSVCYFPKASQYDPEPSEEQETFYDFCGHAGWTLAAASAQMQIFYNERENPVPIHTDPALEVDSIHRAAKKSFLPYYFLLLAVGLLDSGLMLWQLLGDPVWFLSSAESLFAGTSWLLVIILTGVELAGYFLWHGRAEKAAEQGKFLPTRSRVLFQKVMVWLAALNAADWLASSSAKWAAVGVASLLATLALAALVRGVMGLLKRWKIPAGVNRAVTLLSCVLLSLAMAGGLTFWAVHAVQAGWGGSYVASGSPGRDTIPLMVEDLTGEEYEGYAREVRSVSQSRLLARTVVAQHPQWGGEGYVDMPWLDYTVLTPRLAFLYDFWYGLYRDCMLRQTDRRGDSLIPEGDRQYYQPADPDPWGAGSAYRLVRQDGREEDRYLLCYPYHIVEIEFDWEPSPGQMGIVGGVFGGAK